MSIMAKTPSGYKKIGSAYLGEQPVDKVFNANGDVVYALQRELTGVPPLLFKGKEQSELLNYRICGNTETKQRDYSGSSPLTVPVHDGELYNYRIYGNTANGDSVGEKTANLFDMKKFAELCYPRYASVTFADNTLSFTSTAVDAYVNIVHGEGATVADEYRPSCIDVMPSTTYTISMSSAPKCYISWADSLYKTVSTFTRIPANQSSYTFTTPNNCTKILIRLGKEVNNIGDEFTISNIMLNLGSTPLPYEPYGYKVPITVTNSGTTSNETIYLPEPIKMVGSEAEYVDFYSQKQYFADGTSTAVTIPALPISTGTNTVTVNTTVQPSSVEVSTDENESVGDRTGNLFDYSTVTTGYRIIWSNGQPAPDATATISDYIAVNSGTYAVNSRVFVACYDSSKNYLGVYSANGYVKNYSPSVNYIVLNNTCSYIRIFSYNVPEGDSNTMSQTTMLNSGSEALPYEPYGYKVPVTVSNGTDTLTTPIYLPEPIKMVGDEAEYIDYKEQKQHRVRKNLLRNTTTSQTYGGVMVTVNSDGSITCNGTAITHASLRINIGEIPSGIYKLSGCPKNGAYNTYRLDIRDSSDAVITYNSRSVLDTGNGHLFNSTNAHHVELRIENGYTCNNLTFYPMIRKADIEDDIYEPYIENVDLDVTLPALPIIKGTNVLSMDTEVQPSRMDIKGRIKSLT